VRVLLGGQLEGGRIAVLKRDCENALVQFQWAFRLKVKLQI